MAKKALKDVLFMTGEEFRECLGKIGFSIHAAGNWLRIGQKTVYRYAYDGVKIPSTTADLLRALATGKLTLEQVESLRKRFEPTKNEQVNEAAKNAIRT